MKSVNEQPLGNGGFWKHLGLQDPSSWRATFLFAGGSAALALLFYTVPAWLRLLVVALGIALLGLFAWYLTAVRRGERASLGSSLPAVLGPLLAQIYVERRAPEMLGTWHSGGAELVQVAFLFAGWIGLVVYYFARVGEAGENKYMMKSGFVAILLTIFIIALAPLLPADPGHGPVFFGEYRAPALNALTVCRAVVALWGIVLATAPVNRG